MTPPPPFLNDTPLRAVLNALPNARIVGGAVRDTLARRPIADIDLATPDTPTQIIDALNQAGLKHAPTGLQHGTVTAISHGRGFEVTTLRTDQRTDGRHAEVAWTPDWRQDAARRDFTINAMSMTRHGEVHDYFNGIQDLQAGRVRFVGPPARRIAEDHLRVLRFFRFHARYGTTPPGPETEQALQDAVPLLARLSAERVWSETKRILAIPEALPALQLMARLGILEAVLQNPPNLPALERLIQAGAPPDPLLRLAALHPPPTLAERLKLATAEAATLEAYAPPAPGPDSTDDDLRRALATTPPDTLIARTWLAGGAVPPWPTLRHRLAAIPPPVFPLAGRDVVALGIPPGPRVGALLEAVRTWWMQAGCTPGAAACRAQLATLAGH